MTPLLLSTLLLVAQADTAIAEPAPNQQPCPWTQEALTLLYPANGDVAPSNGSIWMRENDGVTPIGLSTPVIEDENGAPVATKATRTPIPTGQMLELRPITQLSPGKQYRVMYEDKSATFTAEGSDFGAPEKPGVASIFPVANAGSNLACDTSGYVVIPGEDHVALHLFIDDSNGEVLGVAARRGADVDAIIVPETPGITACGKLIAMDAAGRRSAPSEPACTSASAVTHPVDLAPQGPFSCEGAGSGPMLFAMLGAIARLARKRKRKGSTSR